VVGVYLNYNGGKDMEKVIAGFRNAQCSFIRCGGYDAGQKHEVVTITETVLDMLKADDVLCAKRYVQRKLAACTMMGEVLDRVMEELEVDNIDEMWSLT
jgi:hypothetical protein